MSSSERVYSLLIQANPIPDPQAVAPVLSPALLDERRSEMLTQEPTETRQIAPRPRWPRAVVAFAATIVIVAVAIGVVAVTGGDGGPVAAGEAQIEVTFTGDGVSYNGHRQIIQGTAEISLFNETSTPVSFIALYFEPGSAELDEELAVLAEGDGLAPDRLPLGELAISESYSPGSHDIELTLEPGTYVFDVGYDNDDPDWWVHRAAVITVVAE